MKRHSFSILTACVATVLLALSCGGNKGKSKDFYTYRYSGEDIIGNGISLWFVKDNSDRLAGELTWTSKEDPDLIQTYFVQGNVDRTNNEAPIRLCHLGENAYLDLEVTGSWQGAGNLVGDIIWDGGEAIPYTLEDIGGEPGLKSPYDPFENYTEESPSIESLALSNDYIENCLREDYVKAELKVGGDPTGVGEPPVMTELFSVISEAYPMPLFLQWKYYGSDVKGVWDREVDIVVDEDNHFLSGKWYGEDYDDHFELKAYEMKGGLWTIGLNYDYLYDGNDGIGVYEMIMFWTYSPSTDRVLRPIIEDDERPFPSRDKVPGRESALLDREQNIITFPGSAEGLDPEKLQWLWSGFWFDHVI